MPEIDAELEREAARNIKEYIQRDLKSEKDMFVWIWKELLNDGGRNMAKKVFWTVLLAYFLAVLKPWTLGLVFTGLAGQPFSFHLVFYGLCFYALVSLSGHFINRHSLRYRELLSGESARQLDKRTTELFFEKSLGTHIDESNLLNEANIRKGYERVSRLISMLVWDGPEIIFGLALPFVALWFLNLESAVLLTIVFVLHILWSLSLNQRIMKDGIPIDRDWRAMNRFRAERLERVERVKINRKEGSELRELGERFEKIIRMDRKLWLWHVEQVVARGVITHLGVVFAMAYGVFMVWKGQMAIGLLYPLFAWSTQLADNFWRVSNLEREINFMTPSILSMKDALTIPVGLENAGAEENLPRKRIDEIEFRNVSHSYGGQKVLDDISFSIKRGDRLAVLGSSGAGKTTICRLLLPFMDPVSGSVRLNGADLRGLAFDAWLPQVGYMPQDAQIFDGTVRYNLLYGLTDEERIKVSDEDLWELMRLLKIDFGERLTHGLETVVGRNGIKLSGGQAQRLMLGAAVVKKPTLLIVDEATSSLDATTERLVQEGLERVLSKDMIAVIITHRLNTVRRICNKFIMLSGNGRGSRVVAQAGGFEELAEKSPEFIQLAKDQGIVL